MPLSRSPLAALSQQPMGWHSWLPCGCLGKAPLTALAWALVAASLAPVSTTAAVAESAANPAFSRLPTVGCDLLWQISVHLDTLPR